MITDYEVTFVYDQVNAFVLLKCYYFNEATTNESRKHAKINETVRNESLVLVMRI